ncbi:Sedlin [Ascosphaera apis ARSEF 7405]|uniref:Sedlin n=1 Tax=Ascosphaera apis ARSEF 7405 TaxID=392613 RepID=A0A167VWS3_9EURO|nr:Sedlin [Ascosphaera apis ARSEF 7405]
MSYYFTILSPTDAPLFSLAFGTSKAGGDGIARFRFPDSSRYMNQFMIHASLDILEEVQWTNGAMYLKHIDSYSPSSCYISAFLTGSGARFLLLHQPHSTGLSNSHSSTAGGGAGPSGGSTPLSARASSSSIANNPTSPQTEEAIRQFMNEVYENWVKAVMSPFYKRGGEIRSSVFRGRVVAAGKKWL